MWGLSTISAEKLQFEVEDEITGLAIKTTVVEYFKSRYKLALRYFISLFRKHTKSLADSFHSLSYVRTLM